MAMDYSRQLPIGRLLSCSLSHDLPVRVGEPWAYGRTRRTRLLSRSWTSTDSYDPFGGMRRPA
jgi:hypothetical protein